MFIIILSLFHVYCTISVPCLSFFYCSMFNVLSLFHVYCTVSVPRLLYCLCSMFIVLSLFHIYCTISIPCLLYCLCYMFIVLSLSLFLILYEKYIKTLINIEKYGVSRKRGIRVFILICNQDSNIETILKIYIQF